MKVECEPDDTNPPRKKRVISQDKIFKNLIFFYFWELIFPRILRKADVIVVQEVKSHNKTCQFSPQFSIFGVG